MATRDKYRGIFVTGILIFAMGISFFAGCGERGTSTSPPAGTAGGETAKRAVTFSLQDLMGKTVSLESLQGKVVILDFWATWCGPCKEAMPVLQQLSDKYANKGVVVIGVNQRESREKVKDFITSNKFTYQQLLDSDGKVGSDYGVEGIPTLVIIDQKGNQAMTHVGYTPELANIISEKVDSLLKGA
jgi:thiol-disulfide isomerase/thioredoxin